MTDILNTIVFIVYAITLGISIGLFLMYYRKYRKFIAIIAKLIIDKQTLADKLDMANLENSKEVNDGFIRFLSESRQAAFDYIENVQIVVKNYINSLDEKDNEKITAYRLELMALLPSEGNDVDKV